MKVVSLNIFAMIFILMKIYLNLLLHLQSSFNNIGIKQVSRPTKEPESPLSKRLPGSLSTIQTQS